MDFSSLEHVVIKAKLGDIIGFQIIQIAAQKASFQLTIVIALAIVLVLATVPGYPASVRVGTDPKAPVRVRNHQVTRPALSWRVCYPDRT